MAAGFIDLPFRWELQSEKKKEGSFLLLKDDGHDSQSPCEDHPSSVAAMVILIIVQYFLKYHRKAWDLEKGKRMPLNSVC